MAEPAAKPAAEIHPKRRATAAVKMISRIIKTRSRRGIACAKKRSAGVEAVSGGFGSAGILDSNFGHGKCRGQSIQILLVRFVLREGRGHTDHLGEAYYGAEDDSGQVNPMRAQPAIEEPSEGISEKDCRWNDEADFGVAGCGHQRVGLGRTVWVVG